MMVCQVLQDRGIRKHENVSSIQNGENREFLIIKDGKQYYGTTKVEWPE